jgi:hypothetical protein
MASTYSSNLKIELMSTGENAGTWGNITNTNLGTAYEQAVIGLGNPDYTSDANLTITLTDSNASQAARCLVLNVTSAFGSLTATRELIVPTIQKQYIVQNNTTGGQSITVKTSAGTGITVPNGRKAHLYVNGTNVIQMFDFVNILGGTIDNATLGATTASSARVTTLNASGATTLDGTVALGNAAGDLITVPGTVNSNLIFTDNTYDIGASGATRPRNLFLAGAATVGGNLSVGGTLTLTGGVNLNGNVTVGDTSADTLTINATITSNLIFTDNTYDIGASGATRPRNLFLAGNATIGGAQTLTGALTVDSTTDSSSTTTGSIQTDGGVGIAKALFVGTTANIAGVATFSAGTASLPAITTTGNTNTGIFFPAADTIAFTEGGVESMRITSAGNLGIGTTSPLGKVHSSSASSGATPSGNANQLVAENSGNAGITIASGAASLGNLFFADSGDAADGYVQYDQSGRTMRFGIATAEGMRLTSTGLGIGTSAPTQRLEVLTGTSTNDAYNPAAAFGTAAGANQGGVIGSRTIAANTTQGLYISSGQTLTLNSSAGIRFQIGSLPATALDTTTEYMRLTTTGLGIGTISPATKLDVSASSGANTVRAVNTGTSTADYSVQSYFRVDVGGNHIGGMKTTARNFVGLSTPALILNTSGAYPIAFALNDSPTPSMVLDASGNLGLGVVPFAWSTNGNFDQKFYTSINTWDDGFKAVFQSGNNYYQIGSTFYYKATTEASFYRQRAGAHSWHSAASGTAGTAISFTQAMTLDASGRLLLGTTSGTSGQLIISCNGSTQNAINFVDTSGAGRSFIFGPGIGSGTAGDFGFYDLTASQLASVFTGGASGKWVWYTNGTERARIDSSGNFTIGGQTATRLEVNLTENDKVELNAVDSTNTARNLVFSTGDTERARIDTSGNLLVGTTTAVSGSNHIVVGSNSIQGIKQDFTNLGTTPQSFGFAAAGPGVYVCSMKSIGGASVAFLISAVFNNASIDMFTTALGNCTAGGNTGTISGITSDARTYTFSRNGGTGLFEVTASSTATGTTTFYMTPLNVFA